MMKNTVLTFLFFLLCMSLQADFVLTPNVKAAHKAIFELRLNSAEQIISAEKKVNPGNNFVSYLNYYVAFTKVFISEDEKLYEHYETQFSDWITEVKKAPEKSPWRGSCLSEMYMLRAALKLKFGKSIKAGLDGTKAYNQAEETYKNHPLFQPNKLNWGLINIAVGSVPDNYKGLASTFGYEGDISEGIQLVRQSWNYSLKPENEYLNDKNTLIYAYANLQLNYGEFYSLDSLNLPHNYKDNVLLIYLQSKYLQGKGSNEEVIKLLEDRPNDKGIYPFHYLDYMEGKAKVAAQNSTAPIPLTRYLRLYKGKHFIKATHYQLAIHYFLNGEKSQAEKHISLLRVNGNTFTGADKMADYMATRKMNFVLLKAQVLYDNANYNEALSILEENANYCFNRTDSLEMYYRKGRILQALNLEYDAFLAYKTAIDLDQSKHSYYAANSALQLALMLEKKQMEVSSNIYFNLVLDYHKYPFEDGMQQQAKAGKKRTE